MTPAPTLAARGVSKSFFGNPVLRDVSIALHPGRIHALLGENGAGKSTLINILSGALLPDEGVVEIDGRSFRGLNPRDAHRAGVAVVQQELGLTSQLSIAENIGLGALPRRYGLIDYRCLARRARAAMDLVGLDEDLATPVGDLPLGRRQMVEIAKALFREPRVLILDEPTSSLSAHEVETLTSLLDRLCAKNVAILYISHRLNEIMRVCQHVTVLKDGVVTADRSIEGVEAADLVRLMVGRDTGHLFPAWTPTTDRDPIVSVSGLSAGVLRNIDISIRRGEVLGVGGLVGQGQEDLLLSLYGALPASARTAEFNGRAKLPRRFARPTRWDLPMCRLIANAKAFISFTTSAGTSCCQASRAHLGCRCATERKSVRSPARSPTASRSRAISRGKCRRCPVATSRKWRWRNGRRPSRKFCC